MLAPSPIDHVYLASCQPFASSSAESGTSYWAVSDHCPVYFEIADRDRDGAALSLTSKRAVSTAPRVIRALVLAAVLVLGGGGCTRIETDALPNVRLGMAPRDVRDRFEPGGEGAWQTSLGAAADDTALEWKAKGPSKVKDARFEFHLGMLVAIRATTTDPAPDAEKVSSTPKTVTVRRAAPGGGTEIAVLARDCPTHKDEAERLATKAR